MRKPLPKRFHTDNISDWQKCANKTHRGNLTRWMEEHLNRCAKKELKVISSVKEK